MLAIWGGFLTGFDMVSPFLAAVVIIALLTAVGDRGARAAMRRNSPCLAALCIFLFAMGSGLSAWFLGLMPGLYLFGAAGLPEYPLLMMYWGFWLAAGLMLAAKRIIYDRRPGRFLED